MEDDERENDQPGRPHRPRAERGFASGLAFSVDDWPCCLVLDGQARRVVDVDHEDRDQGKFGRNDQRIVFQHFGIAVERAVTFIEEQISSEVSHEETDQGQTAQGHEHFFEDRGDFHDDFFRTKSIKHRGPSAGRIRQRISVVWSKRYWNNERGQLRNARGLHSKSLEKVEANAKDIVGSGFGPAHSSVLHSLANVDIYIALNDTRAFDVWRQVNSFAAKAAGDK